MMQGVIFTWGDKAQHLYRIFARPGERKAFTDGLQATDPNDLEITLHTSGNLESSLEFGDRLSDECKRLDTPEPIDLEPWREKLAEVHAKMEKVERAAELLDEIDANKVADRVLELGSLLVFDHGIPLDVWEAYGEEIRSEEV